MPAFDPGIVGVSYQAPLLLQDAENAINWYVEVGEVDGAKEALALLGCPGLSALPTLLGVAGPVRALWVLPGGVQMLIVVGTQVILATVTVPATQFSIAQFGAALVGTLLTNAGPVHIRDNGPTFGGFGGYALLVDGTFGYYYALTGILTTVSFSGSTQLGSPIITLPGSLPPGLILAGTNAVLVDITLSDGTVHAFPAQVSLSSIDYNTPAVVMSQNALVSYSTGTLTLAIQPFGVLIDPGFPVNPTHVAFIEGWLIVNSGGSRSFQVSGPIAYSMTFPPSFYALKDSSSDNLVSLIENNRELWLIGERTSEVWYNGGGATFPFSRVPGVGPQIGCAAPHSVSRAGSSLMWLAKNEQGENIVIRTNQYSWDRISVHAVEHALSSYPQVSDALAYAYEEEGHLFYVLTLPTADSTWVYDLTVSANVGKPCWHQRLSYDPGAGRFHRHWGNCFANFQNLRVIGDYQNGLLYQMSRLFFTDNGTPLKAQRRSKHVWSKADRERVSQSSLQVEFTPGVGVQQGQGVDPTLMLRWSDDGGFSWSNEHALSIGKAGQMKNRARLNRLGAARDRVYEINFTDPVPRDVIGATLYAEVNR